MAKIKAIQTYLGTEKYAKVEGRRILTALKRAVRENDHENLLVPEFDFNRDCFNIAWRITDTGHRKEENEKDKLTADDLNAMGKKELKKFIADEELDVVPDEFKDVDELREAVAETLGIDLDEEEQEEKGDDDFFVGFGIWQPGGSDSLLARISVHRGWTANGNHKWAWRRVINGDDEDIEEGYYLNCPAMGAKIDARDLLAPNSWTWIRLEFRRFSLTEDFSPTRVAREIINLAKEVFEKIILAETE